MWPIYVIYVAQAAALLAAVATVPIARRGARRLLWSGSIALAFVLSLAATSSATRLVPPGMWPVWRFAVMYLLLLAAPIGVAALVADHLARKQPMPKSGRHAALVACAVVATVAACAVASRPLTPDFIMVHSEQ